MHGLGTIVNCTAILVGSLVGMFIKGGLSRRFEEIIFSAVGLSVMFIGLGGAISGLISVTGGVLETRYTMLLVLSLVLGAITGEILNIEKCLDNMGKRIKERLPQRFTGNTFVEGFVTASMLFCVGAMAIVGSLEDGLRGNYSILFAKAVLDGITSVLFAASLGFGVAVSILPLAVYQGGITLLAGFMKPWLSDALIGQMSCVGSILIFAIGINMIFGKKIKVGNLLPAIFFPIIFNLVKLVWPGFPV